MKKSLVALLLAACAFYVPSADPLRCGGCASWNDVTGLLQRMIGAFL